MGDAGPSTPLQVSADDGSDSISSSLDSDVRDIHVLVTGFGPFKSFYINPSWLIASNLRGTLEPEVTTKPVQPSSDQIRLPNHQPYRIVIHTYPSAIRVSYSTVASTIPTLLSPVSNPSGINYDYVFHIGLASGRDSYTLETVAHRDFYKIKDVDDKDGFLSGEVPWKQEGVPDKIEVGWNAQDVLTRWSRMVSREEDEIEEALLENWETRQKALGSLPESNSSNSATARQQKSPTEKRAVVKLSKDAGRFLCEFTLMASLADRWCDAIKDSAPQTSPPSDQDPKEKLGKAAFLHVPNGIAVPDIVRGKRVAEAAIRALVASWEDGYRNPRVYQPHDSTRAVIEPETQHGSAKPPTTMVSGAFEAKSTGDS